MPKADELRFLTADLHHADRLSCDPATRAFARLGGDGLA